MAVGVVDRFWRQVDSHGGRGYMGEISSSVSGTATEVENAAPHREARCQRVASDVLPPQIVIDLAGNDAFSCEFAHGVTTLLPTLVFTLTRQSK